MSARPRVTIAIPFHDEEAHLAAAVRSILAQTYTDFELLLLDDGSQDGSLAIAKSFDDPRITVLSDGRRRHLPARLNEVVARARGELVARMDADDLSHPDRIRRQVALLDREPRLDAVGSLAILLDEEEEPFAIVGTTDLPFTRAAVLESGLMVHATMLARRRWLRENPYDELLTRAEDRELWWRTIESSRFAVAPEPLYLVRVLTAENDEAFLRGYQESIRQNRALFVQHGPTTSGILRTVSLVLGSYAKSAVVSAAARAGMLRRLVGRRGRSPAPEERAMALEALAAAKASTGG